MPQGSGRLIRRPAIQRRRQNARHRGLANAAVAAEDVTMRGASLFERVLQGSGDVLLSDDLGEFLRTIFACQDGVAHEQEGRLYVIEGKIDLMVLNRAAYVMALLKPPRKR